MSNEEIYKQGYESYKPYLNVYDTNPYKRIEERKNGEIKAFQAEAVPFFNGWEAARREQEKTTEYSLFLDDFRFPNWINYIAYPADSNWVIARHYYEFIDAIKKNGIPKIVTFDYDLDLHGMSVEHLGPYLNGLDCAKWLAEYCDKNNLKFPLVAVHSQNPDGGKQIYEFLKGYLEKKQNVSN